jgi:hypothetical protein
MRINPATALRPDNKRIRPRSAPVVINHMLRHRAGAHVLVSVIPAANNTTPPAKKQGRTLYHQILSVLTTQHLNLFINLTQSFFLPYPLPL